VCTWEGPDGEGGPLLSSFLLGIMIILPTLRTPTLVHAHLISEQQAQGTTLEPQTYVTQSMDSQTVTAVVGAFRI
jgi:hypothetical protein